MWCHLDHVSLCFFLNLTLTQCIEIPNIRGNARGGKSKISAESMVSIAYFLILGTRMIAIRLEHLSGCEVQVAGYSSTLSSDASDH